MVTSAAADCVTRSGLLVSGNDELRDGLRSGRLRGWLRRRLDNEHRMRLNSDANRINSGVHDGVEDGLVGS